MSYRKCKRDKSASTAIAKFKYPTADLKDIANPTTDKIRMINMTIFIETIKNLN